jgi:addiction module HigA family antidote
MARRIIAQLEALNEAGAPEDMNLPGFDFHALRGFVPTRYTIHVNGPWCITFEFSDGDAYRVDFEQYHEEPSMEYPAIRDPKRPPLHPGAFFREEVLPSLGKSKAEIARLLGISRKTLYDILGEKQPVTPGMALRLGKLCGNGPNLWANMQRSYDLYRAEIELSAEIKKIPTLSAA